MRTVRLPKVPRRRAAATLALAGLVASGGYAVASTLGAPAGSRIQVPAQEVHQAGGVSRVPALPLLEGVPGVTSASSGAVQHSAGTAGWTAPDTTGGAGIPRAALAAYELAAGLVDRADAACHLDWALLAGIGRVESDHGRWGGNALDATGEARPGIFGIPLDGAPGIALIRDTDGGRLDRDGTYDRAVGPFQFIPGTWSAVGVDADGDGRANPQSMVDAATSAGVYLCSGPGDLTRPADVTRAVLRYNDSTDYVNTVLAWANAYRSGVSVLPDGAVDTGAQAFLPPGLRDGGSTGPTEPAATRPSARPTPTGGFVVVPGARPSSSATASPTGGGGATPTAGSTAGPSLPVALPTGAVTSVATAVPTVVTTAVATTVAPPVAVGDTVRILDGALLGLTGTVTAVDTTHRTVTVAVTTLGLTQQAVLPWADVEKV